jgi:hypothetical protein
MVIHPGVTISAGVHGVRTPADDNGYPSERSHESVLRIGSEGIQAALENLSSILIGKDFAGVPPRS